MAAGMAVVYLILAGTVLWLWLGQSGVATSLDVTLVCFAPAVLGVVLASTSTADQNQYILRNLACVLFTPVLLLFWGTSLDPAVAMPGREVWPFATAAGLGHAVAFVGLIFWGGSVLTVVPAAPGVSACGVDMLRARLLSLRQLPVPFTLSSDGAGNVIARIQFAAGENRGHSITLKLDAERHHVRVQEKLAADGARPRTEDEASMRGPGDPYFDPGRPDATSISARSVQTSMIDPQRLAATPLRLFQHTVELPADFAAALDADGVVTLLCAVVTQSGWQWRPVFFGTGKS